MGLCQSKKKDDKLYLVAFNLNQINTSFYSSRIVCNFIKKFQGKNYVICVQGLRDNSYKTCKNDNFDKIHGLLTSSNLETCDVKIIPFHYDKLLNFNSNNYGFQHTKFKLNEFDLNIYNIELIKDNGNLYDFNKMREKQIIQLINYISNSDHKINIVLGTFYNFKNQYKNLVQLSSIKDIYTNVNNNKAETLIFLHLRNEFKNLSFLESYQVNNFKIQICDTKTHDLQLNNNLAFELVIKIKKI